MNKQDHIENLFREGFRDFESPPDPTVFAKIMQQLSGPQSAAPDTSMSVGNTGHGAANNILAKWLTQSLWLTGCIVGAALVTYIAIDTYTGSETNNQPAENTQLQPVAIENTNIVHEGNSSNSISHRNEMESVQTAKSHHPSISLTNAVSENHPPRHTPVADQHHTEAKTKSSSPIQQPSQARQVSAAETPSDNETKPPIPNNLTPSEPTRHLVTTGQYRLSASAWSGPAPFSINLSIQGENIAETEWIMGDGAYYKNSREVNHTYLVPGKYLVNARITNTEGTVQMEAIEINVLPQQHSYQESQLSSLNKIPNVFSPNGDGINDYFVIDGKNIASFRIVIQDAKGKIVFESNTMEIHWDGKDATGNNLPEGRYFYMISANGTDGQPHHASGIINLMR